MSWFKRRPKIKEAPKEKPHHISPMTEKMLRDTKEKTKPDDKDKLQKKE